MPIRTRRPRAAWPTCEGAGEDRARAVATGAAGEVLVMVLQVEPGAVRFAEVPRPLQHEL